MRLWYLILLYLCVCIGWFLRRFRHGLDAKHFYVIAFLSDHEPSTQLKSIRQANCLQVTISSRVSHPLRCLSPTGALSGWGGTYIQYPTSTGTSYRGTQPHNTESVVIGIIWVQTATISIRQQQYIKIKSKRLQKSASNIFEDKK